MSPKRPSGSISAAPGDPVRKRLEDLTRSVSWLITSADFVAMAMYTQHVFQILTMRPLDVVTPKLPAKCPLYKSAVSWGNMKSLSTKLYR